MSISKLYRNKEVKKLTLKYIIILVFGIISIVLLANILIQEIDKKVLTNNISILSEIINNEGISEDAIELLKSYGYHSEISLAANDLAQYLYKRIIGVFSIVFILFISILYILFMFELKKIYKIIDNVSNNIKHMSTGEYRSLDSHYTEGDIAVMISSLNYMGERVNNSIAKLQNERENLKDFLSDISHQLKTPLASLVMFNDLLKDNEEMLYKDRLIFLEKSEEQLIRMEWLIMNLLKVGRLEAGAIVFKEENILLKDTIDLSISSLREMANKKNQSLTISGDLDCYLVHDKEWLAEALTNIIKNSIEHTQEEGKININISRGPIITKIIIEDNGEGIPKDMQDKIFKRFYKGENNTNPTSIGIGLSLSKSIIEKLNGEIKLISEEGKGSKFIISFIR